MSEWQPISTAPRDGSNVLVVGAKGDVDLASWQEAVEAEKECGVPVECDVDEGWYGNLCYPAGWQPTHWMPLPDPPKERS